MPGITALMQWAVFFTDMGNPALALDTYTRAVDIERGTDSYFVAQSKAAYYSQLGLYDESRRSYDDLLRHPQLKPADRDMFLQNMDTLARLRGR